jgi:hypothetical protein
MAFESGFNNAFSIDASRSGQERRLDLHHDRRNSGTQQVVWWMREPPFDLPMVIQVDRLPYAKQPTSEDVNLDVLWSDPAQLD